MIVLVLPDETGDSQLLERAKHGDKEAIGQIYRQYVESIYQFARLRTGTTQSAEDITNTVFEAFIDALARGKGPRTSLRGWLFQVARYTIYAAYREKTPLPIETIDQMQFDSPDPEQALLESLDRDTIRALIQTLSPDQQEVLLLRFDQQLSLQETAAVMDKNVNTIKTLQLRAIQKLRSSLQRQQMREDL